MFGSRRQEAQRLGRLLRPKGKMVTEEFNGFFYSLISRDTREVHFSTKRQQFLIRQGYAFKLIHELPLQDLVNPVLSTPLEQKQLLTRVLTASESALEGERIAGEDEYEKKKTAKGVVRKTGSSLAARTGGTQRQYEENFSHAADLSALRKMKF